MHFSLDRMLEWTPYILEGLKVIIVLSLVCALIGVVTGTVCAFLKKKKGIGWLISAYIDFFRGTRYSFSCICSITVCRRCLVFRQKRILRQC